MVLNRPILMSRKLIFANIREWLMAGVLSLRALRNLKDRIDVMGRCPQLFSASASRDVRGSNKSRGWGGGRMIFCLIRIGGKKSPETSWGLSDTKKRDSITWSLNACYLPSKTVVLGSTKIRRAQVVLKEIPKRGNAPNRELWKIISLYYYNLLLLWSISILNLFVFQLSTGFFTFLFNKEMLSLLFIFSIYLTINSSWLRTMSPPGDECKFLRYLWQSKGT